MRKSLALTGLLLVVGASPGQEQTETITASASATVFVRPDTARLHFTVAATEPSLDTAKENAAKQAEAAASAIKALKLGYLTTTAGSPTYTQRVMAGRGGFGGPVNPGGNPAPPPVQTHYYARVPLSLTLRESDPDKLLASLDAVTRKLLEVGASVSTDTVVQEGPQFGGGGFGGGGRTLSSDISPRIEWLVADDAAARKEAYRIAVRKARANAEAISKEIGWETLKVVSVLDGASQPRDLVESGPRPGAGEVAVTARVTLKCSR